MLSIRFATESDVGIILTFIKDLAEYEKLTHEVVATPELIKLHLFSSERVAEALIAEYNSKPVGFAIFFKNFSTFLALPGIYLEDLFVNPDYRGKGIGKSLLLELVKIAHERGYGRVEWAVLNWNSPAIKFYDSLGAKPNSEWTVYRIRAEQFSKLVNKN